MPTTLESISQALEDDDATFYGKLLTKEASDWVEFLVTQPALLVKVARRVRLLVDFVDKSDNAVRPLYDRKESIYYAFLRLLNERGPQWRASVLRAVEEWTIHLCESEHISRTALLLLVSDERAFQTVLEKTTDTSNNTTTSKFSYAYALLVDAVDLKLRSSRDGSKKGNGVGQGRAHHFVPHDKRRQADYKPIREAWRLGVQRQDKPEMIAFELIRAATSVSQPDRFIFHRHFLFVLLDNLTAVRVNAKSISFTHYEEDIEAHKAKFVGGDVSDDEEMDEEEEEEEELDEGQANRSSSPAAEPALEAAIDPALEDEGDHQADQAVVLHVEREDDQAMDAEGDQAAQAIVVDVERKDDPQEDRNGGSAPPERHDAEGDTSDEAAQAMDVGRKDAGVVGGE